MSWVLLAIQLGVAAMFLVAATAKALRSDEFNAALRSSRLPERAIAPVGAIVPVLEVCVATALVLQTPRTLPVALAAAAVLLAVFAVWMAWVRAHGLRVRCGCFGTGSNEVGTRSIWRNLTLLALTAIGLVLARRTSSPLPGPSLWLLVTVTTTGLWVALLVALWTTLPRLVLDLDFGQRGLRPGREG